MISRNALVLALAFIPRLAAVPPDGEIVGRHLLNASFPLARFDTKERKIIAVDAKLFEGYTGRYEMAPKFILSITHDGDHLYAQATGQGRFEIFPEAEKEFFAKVADIQITFNVGADGKATSVVVHQAGGDTLAKRIAGAPEKVKDRKEIAVDPAILEGYTGKYRVTPEMTLVVTREGGRLFTQATGQEKFEVFAESATQFFAKAFDAQLTFRADARGKASEVVLHQSGLDIPCKRYE